VLRGAARPRPVRTLASPAFRRLMASTVAAYAARFLDMTALSWLVVQLTPEPLPVALLSFFRFIPYLAAGPLAGPLADRFPRTHIVRWSQWGLAGLAVALAGLLACGTLQLWHAYLYSLGQGVLYVLDFAARRSYMAATVGPARVTAAVSIDMLAMTAARILFATGSGLALEAAGPSWVFVGLAVLALLSAQLAGRLPPLSASGSARRESFGESVRGGVRFARNDRLVLGGLALVALANLTAFAYEPVVPAVAEEVFGAGPILFGIYLSATGIGSLATSLWLATARAQLCRPGLVALAAAAGLHGLQIAFSCAQSLAASLALLIVIGAVGMAFSIAHSSLFLLAAPDGLRGRVLGLQSLMIGTFPLSSLIVGWLGNQLGVLAAVRVVALGGLAWVVLLGWRLPELRRRIE